MSAYTSYSSSFKWDGGKVTEAVLLGGQRGVNLALERLKALSVPLAPLDDGPLRASATIRPAVMFLAEGALIFDTPYAAIQHEDESFEHPKGGQAKYVEQPLTEHRAELNALIGKGIRNAIARS